MCANNKILFDKKQIITQLRMKNYSDDNIFSCLSINFFSKFFLSCLKELFDENLNKFEVIIIEITIVKFYVFTAYTTQGLLLMINLFCSYDKK